MQADLMVIDVSRLLNGEEQPFVGVFDLADLHPGLTKPVRYHGLIRRKHDIYTLEGEAETLLSLVCDRCAKPFAREFSATCAVTLQEGYEADDREDIYPLRGGKVDILSLFRDVVLFALPSKILCNENCQPVQLSSGGTTLGDALAAWQSEQ